MKIPMNKLEKWFCLRAWQTVVLTIISAVLLVAVFLYGWEETIAAIAVYVFSFYTLIVLCRFGIIECPRLYRDIRGKIYATKYGNRYMTDPKFKTHVNLYRSLMINLLFAGLHLWSGFYYNTAWFKLFAGYYFLMAIMRFLLLRYVSKNGIGTNRRKELKRARLCAYMLLLINLSLTGSVLMMVYFNRGFSYRGIFIYVMAMYTFYITTTAIIRMVKYKKYKSPIMSMEKSINLAAAMISMLSLETAMFAQFGEDTSPKTREWMIILTGAGISIVVLCMSIYTIWKTSKELHTVK